MGNIPAHFLGDLTAFLLRRMSRNLFSDKGAFGNRYVLANFARDLLGHGGTNRFGYVKANFSGGVDGHLPWDLLTFLALDGLTFLLGNG